jgi:hypothetical protein
MLTSAKIGKQNGDTRTRKTETGYLNLSIINQSINQSTCTCIIVFAIIVFCDA